MSDPRDIIAATLSTFYDRPAQAQEIVAALAAAGYKIMPREPTEAMMANMAAYGPGHLVPIFRTMWDAAP